MASTAAPITSSCRTSTPPATARRVRSSNCASSTTRSGRRRVALAVRSDLPIDEQVTARRRDLARPAGVAREPVALGDSGLRRRGSRRDGPPRRASRRARPRRAARAERRLLARPDRDAAPAGGRGARRTGWPRRRASRSMPPRPGNMSRAPTGSASRSPPAASP